MHTQLDIYRTTLEYLTIKAMQYRFAVAPNPTVGACLLYNNNIVAEGYHTHFGGKHAEIMCLDDAKKKGIAIEHCTLVVTLEPCVHYGKTPPCVQAILASGIQRIVVGAMDPHYTATGGIAVLQKHNVEVILVNDVKSIYCIQDFTMWNIYELPHIIVKLATTMDGYIATREYQSKWITNQETRTYIHSIRAKLGEARGAIMVGANTVRHDNPKLYARSNTSSSQPRPIIVSKVLNGLDTSFLLMQRPHDCIIITCEEAMYSSSWTILEKRGVSFLVAGTNTIDMRYALHLLYTKYHIWYIFCEGGGVLVHSLISLPISLELWHCMAPILFADTCAIPMVVGARPLTVEHGYSFTLQHIQTIGNDIIAIYTK